MACEAGVKGGTATGGTPYTTRQAQLAFIHKSSVLHPPLFHAVMRCRQLRQALPPLHSMPSAELPALAQHHLGSSADLAATVRLIMPAAFKDGGLMPNIAALDDVDSSVLGLLTNVVELQLFHMLRAQAITREMRARISLRQQEQQQEQQVQQHQPVPGPATRMCLEGAGSGGSSNDSCSTGRDDSMGYLE